MTLFVDSIALIGILIAAASTFAAVALGYPQIDGISSVAIGLLLKGSSVFLARESKSLLMGEPAYPFIRKSILSIANSHSGCLRGITVQLGPDQIVAMLSLEFADTMLAPDIEEVVIGLEKLLREANPEIVALFVKPQTAKTSQEQRDRALNGSD
jgi:divalent metal cation (Fe/Co/Zn/Cd) transporter